MSISFASGIGSHLVLLKLLQERLREVLAKVTFELGPVYSFEVSELCCRICDRVAEILHLELVALGPGEFLSRSVPEIVKSYKPNSAFCVSSGVPCNKVSSCQKSNPSLRGSGLHHTPSNLHWHLVHRLTPLNDCTGGQALTSAHEQVTVVDPLVVKQIRGTLGPTVKADAAKWNAARRDHAWSIGVACEAKPFEVPVSSFGVVPADLTIDAYRWQNSTGLIGADAKRGPPTLRSFLPVLLEQQVEGKQLRAFELQDVRALPIVNTVTHQTAHAGVKFWLHWLGMSNSAIETALLEIASEGRMCHENIELGGGRAPLGTLASACGELRYCSVCEERLKLLGQSWHLPGALEVWVAAIVPCVPTWLRRSDCPKELLPKCWSYTAPFHECSGDCVDASVLPWLDSHVAEMEHQGFL